MRHEMQCLEDELFQLREERAQLDMERAAAADEADAASAALATAEKRQADLVVAVDEVSLPIPRPVSEPVCMGVLSPGTSCRQDAVILRSHSTHLA